MMPSTLMRTAKTVPASSKPPNTPVASNNVNVTDDALLRALSQLDTSDTRQQRSRAIAPHAQMSSTPLDALNKRLRSEFAALQVCLLCESEKKCVVITCCQRKRQRT
jgi:hypothetical protein